MEWFESITFMFAVGATILCLVWIGWALHMGAVRSSLAIFFRVAWLAPLFLAFFPRTVSERMPKTVSLKPLHIMVDDSSSMSGNWDDEKWRARMDDLCQTYGCIPKWTKLSEKVERTKLGYSPLAEGLSSWLFGLGADPWMLISDGGDQSPKAEWPRDFRGFGLDAEQTLPRAAVLALYDEDVANVWIDSVQIPPFSFEDRPLDVGVLLRRQGASGPERVQVQILMGDNPLATANAEFRQDENEAAIGLTLPALPRGQHLLVLRALPTARETSLWDNETQAQIEVMPNTIGVLHLLGSPSWDGRFLRRYFKAEPKFDLISFFILRDPWDSQRVSERELSLIPFPVDRLFKEELPNFRVVVIQNFSLFRFLQAEYQTNLVNFVKNGGGLLFLGGPRALLPADLSSSPLREILPFEVDGKSIPRMPVFSQMQSDFGNQGDSGTGPAYVQEPFSVQMAAPVGSKRALANVYDEYEDLREQITGWGNAKGIHRVDRMKMKTDVVTPLLYGKLASGDTVPLAVASYPGKGRAIWIFSDSFWRLAMSGDARTARQVYNSFFGSSMTWLMRQDMKKPLVAKSFEIGSDSKDFSVYLTGPATRYFDDLKNWSLKVCGAVLDLDQIQTKRMSNSEIRIQGSMPIRLRGGERCHFELRGEHPAFGSVSGGISALVPKIYTDEEVGAAPHKMEKLAELTGARYLPLVGGWERQLESFMRESIQKSDIALPSRFRTQRDFFWILKETWFWLLMAGLPLEVLVRRWHLLRGTVSRRARVSSAQQK